jgi:hypothetical protein
VADINILVSLKAFERCSNIYCEDKIQLRESKSNQNKTKSATCVMYNIHYKSQVRKRLRSSDRGCSIIEKCKF